MATLTGSTIKDTYTLLLKIDSGGVDSTLRKVEDGDATDSALSISTTAISIDSTDKLHFDAGGDTYIHESSADVLKIVVGNVAFIDMTEGTNALVINEGSTDMDFRVESNGDANMLFVDGGNNRVGIGTASPEQMLHVYKEDAASIISVESTGNGNAAGIEFQRERSDGDGYVGGAIWIDSKTADTHPQMKFGLDSTMTTGDDSKIRMVIGDNGANDGFVGIGLTNPVSELDIYKSDDGSAAGPSLTLTRHSANPADDDILGKILFKGRDDGGGYETYSFIQSRIVDASNATEDGMLEFGSQVAGSGTTNMVVGYNGFVGIGLTDPTNKLTVKGGGDGEYVALFDNSGTGSTAHGISIRAGDADHADNDTHYISFQESDGDAVGTIDSDSGNLGFVDSSDRSLKKDIVNTSIKGLDIINRTRMVDYKWKKNDIQMKCGIIAQELQEVWEDGVSKIDDDILGIKKSKFIYILIKAVQELSAKVEALENK